MKSFSFEMQGWSLATTGRASFLFLGSQVQLVGGLLAGHGEGAFTDRPHQPTNEQV